jgi:hypothetical protein
MKNSAPSIAIATVLFLSLATALDASAQDRPANASSLSGEWKVSLYGQHVIPVGMELAQDGERVTGTLLMWNGDIELTGNVSGGTLTVSGMHTPTDGMPGGTRTVSATMQADGTLLGTFAFNEKTSMKFTAERFNARAARPKPTTAPAVATTSLSEFAGKWLLSLTADPSRTFELDAKVAGDQLTGTLFIDHAGLLEIRNARLKDGALVFDVAVANNPPSEIAVKLADDGSITGAVKGPVGEMPFTGKRK